MSNARFTKLMIAKGLKQLLEATPFAEVSVSNIAKQCKISRNTFYYHFKDKYDVISWIFYTEITPIIGDVVEIEHWSDGLLSLCGYMQENRKFYLNVLEFQGQNSFSECLMDFYKNLTENILRGANGDQVLSSQQIRQISRFYAHGLTGAVLDWAKGGMTQDPKPTIATLEKLLAGDIFKGILQINQEP
ncbi:dihydroxyacetone kinase transcriptional activator DhaS [Oscillospiraceae bacterium LTW-04]|nr:dihydroxyacetone kinase transcriptional activator DhaS [Oscillospiraceae bacterium MB24-C1]